MATGGDYRLVSEEDWQNLNEALAQAKREAGCFFIGQHDWQIRSEHYERKLQQALGELEDRKKDVLFWQSEAERARLETENLTNDLFNLRWQYSHVDPNADEPIGFNDCPCDEPKPAGHWTSDREWEADPEPCDGCAGCSCAENEQAERIAKAVADELMERLRAFVL